MIDKVDGINYAPVSTGKVIKTVEDGVFAFSVIGLDHGHIYAMANGLTEAGAGIRKVYDPDEKKVDAFLEKFPQAERASSIDEILSDGTIQLVASAIRPDKRASLGIRAMKSGLHFFCDKPGLLKREELEEVKRVQKETKRWYMVYFGERVHVEGAVCAERLIKEGKLGKVISVTILAPHRLNKPSRPEWFFDPEKNGTILGDIGSHQFEQLLSYTGAESGRVEYSREVNYANPDHPLFKDYGEAVVSFDNGAAGYVRVDWFTPDGLSAWGDGRVFIVGTKATVEIRKYINVGVNNSGDNVFFVDKDGEHYISAAGKEGFPFFGEFILDCINGSETCMTQSHVFESMRLTIEAHEKAEGNNE